MKLIIGRAGYGKSYYCMNEIKQNLEEAYDRPLIYIVPEQFALTAEYDISKAINRGGTLEVQVFSFKRLCHRIYNEFGYKMQNITKPGKAMLVYSIMKDLEKDLTLLNGVDRKPGLVSTVCDLISEFKRYNVTPEILLNANVKDGRLTNKLRELAYIYAEYQRRVGDKFLDTDDDLNAVLKFIDNSKFINGAKIWIDSFDGFTPQELEVVKAINKRADLTIAISADSENSELFLLNKKTIEKLKRFSNVEEIFLENESKKFNNDELRFLEKYYNVISNETYNENTKHIDISINSNLYSEVENIAIDILKKVRNENYRYENILVATRNVESYKPIFKMLFERYGIPYFIDAKTDLSMQPLISLVLAILDIASKNFQTESIITYLKTGLSNISDFNDVDVIENYVLKYGIKGLKWLQEWKYDNEETNKKINIIREKVVTPIVNFMSKLDKKKTVRELTVAIYEFLIDIEVEKNLKDFLEKVKDNTSSAEAMFANSYVQVWNIFMKLLDELVQTMGEDNITFEKYASVLKQGILTQEIGLIPTSKDQIVIGDIARSKNSHIKVLYVVGVNDGIFPMQYNEEGFLNDNDRNILMENEVELAKDTKMMLLEENFNIYKILTTPSDELHLSYPITDDAGTTLRPSSVINQIKKLFKNITKFDYLVKEMDFKDLINTQESTFTHLALNIREIKTNDKIDKRWLGVYRWYEKNNPNFVSLIKSGLEFDNSVVRISSANARGLYGSTMNSSVSKMETFASCPFMFYLRYGLNIKERKVFKLETPDIGVFMHDILDKFSKYLEKNNLSWRELEREEIDDIADKIVDDTLGELRYQILTSSNRLKFMSIKLKRVIKRVLWIITMHIKNSEFDVAGSEINFGVDKEYPALKIELKDGNTLLLNGKIDRLDIAKTEDNKYVRIIDYKSSAKEINLSNVYYGLQLQLITYLDVASEKEYTPGGALYLKLDDPIISTKKDITPEEIENEIRTKLKMNGIILADVKLVKAMDTNMTTESQNLNLGVKKDGSFTKMPVATQEQLKDLCKHTKKLLKEFAEEILDGDIKNEPIKNKKHTPCEYCDYKEICNFDRELGNKFRMVNELKNEEVFEQIKLF